LRITRIGREHAHVPCAKTLLARSQSSPDSGVERGTAVDQNGISQLTGRAPRLVLEDIVRDPRLPAARKSYLDGLLVVYGDHPFLVRLLIEAGRLSIFQMIAMLEAAQDPARRETWLTVGRLKEKMLAYGLGSGRHVDDLIGRLCAVGFLELRQSAPDRRIRIVTAAETLWAYHRNWLAAHFAPLALLYPQHCYEPVLRRDPTFHRHFRRAGAETLPLGAMLFLAAPDMLLFLRHAGGLMVLAALLCAAMSGGSGTHAAVPYGDLGERFGISRTHVRRLLSDAAAAGLVRLHARGGRCVELLPRLWESFDRGMATGMQINDLVYAAASVRREAGSAMVARAM
jgi:hypothetical protein